MKIKNKIILWVTLAVSIIALAWSLFFSNYLKLVIEKDVYTYLNGIGGVKKVVVENYLEDAKKQYRVFEQDLSQRIIESYQANKLASHKNLALKNELFLSDEYQTKIKNYLKIHEKFSEIILVNSQGEILFTQNKTTHYANIKTLKFDKIFQAGLFKKMSQDLVFSDIFEHKKEVKFPYFILLGGPIYDQNNKFLGILALKMDISNIESLSVKQVGIKHFVKTYLVGHDYLMRSNSVFFKNHNILERKVKTKITQACFAQNKKKLGIYKDFREVYVLGISTYLPALDWCLISEIDAQQAFAIIHDFKLWMYIGSFFAFILIFILSSIIAQKATNPLLKLSQIVQKFGAGNLSIRVNEQGKDEISNLARIFNKMATSLQITTEEIEQKVANQTKIIKQQKKIAEDLALERKKFYLSVENAAEHIVILDTQQNIIYANKTVEKFTGFTQKEIIGQNLRDLWAREMSKLQFKNLWQKITTQKISHQIELENTRKDGTKYIVKAHVSPILKEDESGDILFYVMIEDDISQRKEVDRMKNEFIDIASHELRTPMTLIKGYASMILEDFSDEMPKIAQKQVQHILKNTERLIAMVNDMLDISKIESGKMEELAHQENIDMKDCFRVFKTEFLPSFRKKQAHLKLEFKAHNPVAFYNKNALKRVLTNLIGNALKFIPEKTGEIILRIESNNKNFWKITVQDNGPGISKEDQNKIFKKFGMVEASKNHTTGGTGLGLTIAKAIIQKNSGKIWLASEEKKGCAFIFTIPKGKTFSKNSKKC